MNKPYGNFNYLHISHSNQKTNIITTKKKKKHILRKSSFNLPNNLISILYFAYFIFI